MPDRGKLFNETASAVRFKPDYWVLVVPLNPSPDMMDYLSALEDNYKFKISIIPLAQIEEALYRYPELKHVLLYGELPNHIQPAGEESVKCLESID